MTTQPVYGNEPAYAGGVYAGQPAGNPTSQVNGGKWPNIVVEVAFTDTSPFAEPAQWTDITAFVQSISIRRGRQHELARFEAGTMDVVVDNRDGQFSPFSTANQLTAQDASLEAAGVGDWTVDANCSLSNSTANAADGTHSLLLTSVAAGDMSATIGGLARRPVVPGVTYSAVASSLAASTARNFLCLFNWFDGGGNFLSQSAGSAVANNTATFTQATISATAPAGAATVATGFRVQATGAANEAHYFDKIGFFNAANRTTWDLPQAGGSSPYAPNVVPYRQVRARYGYNGGVFNLFRGQVEYWPMKWGPSPADADSTLKCVDALKTLDLKKASNLSAYQAIVIADGAVAYYPLSDAPGTTSPANLGSGSFAATVVTNATSLTQPFAAVFGGPSALQGVAATSFDAGSGLGAFYLPVGNTPAVVTFECWVNLLGRNVPNGPLHGRSAVLSTIASNGNSADVEIGDGVTALQPGNVVALAGTIALNTLNPNGSVMTSPIAVNDGRWHHIVVVNNGAGNTSTIYVDGVSAATSTTLESFVGGNVAGNTAAVAGFAVRNGAGATPELNGAIADVAFYTAALSATQVANHYLAGRFPRQAESSGSRITALLNAASWPAALQRVDTGKSTVQAATDNDVKNSVLSRMQLVADTEDGFLFVSADGRVTFYDRYHANQSPNNLPAIVLGDSGVTGAGGESPYIAEKVDIQYDDLDLYNEIVVTPLGAGASIADDTTSQATYGVRSASIQTLDAQGGTNPLSRAQADLARLKTPLMRVAAVAFTPMSDPDVLFPAAGFELLTEVEFRRRPLDATSSVFDQVALIEGVEHKIGPGTWETTWRLSPTLAIALGTF